MEAPTLVTACRDPKDNKFLELAMAARAEILVSSDVRLLEMHPFDGIQILSLTHFKQAIFEPS